eukprot:CAMPEP_0172361260 /NCGR_PEP_ID=MMETSP1060-20121228/5117_1 /TAXON_ID=37318 /ORGANISM="Pseudo-nitzschia pungens, Strain cf. cingulata" /LENGTH=1286 /DNA_ID=CAMNT_0013083473 /DNA_START=670 /DNA_END=4530 /DNA_ORIENTATION=+
MHIKQITISNFRSFRQQPEIHPFAATTNCVLGRNGSGKSNLFDAVQFVLLAPRFATLRSEERQALLHEGSGSAAVNAFVEVVFDNSDNRFSLEHSDEVVLRRTVGSKKDEFFLQRKRATKQEVQSLLEGAGFSKSNPYFMVQQGKIQSLCLMTDVQRLELLQQVAGTTLYEDKKSESLVKMQENSQSIEKIDSILGDIDERLNELQGEKEELTVYQSLDRDRKALEYTLYDKELRKARLVLDNIEHKRVMHLRELTELHEHCKKTHDDIQNADAVLKVKTEKLKRNRNHRALLEQDRRTAYKLKEDLVLKCEELEGTVGMIRDNTRRNQAELESLGGEIHSTRGRLDDKKAALREEEDALRKMEQERDQAARKIDGLYARQGRGKEHDSKEERDESLRQQIRETEGQQSQKQQVLTQQRDALANLRRQIVDLEASIESGKTEGGSKHEALQALHKRLEDRQNQRLKLMDVRKNAWRRAESLTETLAECREARRSAHDNLYRSIPRNTSLGLRSLERIVDREGLVRGRQYFGMVLENMTLKDPKFRTAVEVASQNALFHVVVDTDATAALLMKRLEEGKLGRVTFMPLNQLRVQNNTQYPQSGDIAPLLSTCIDYDPGVKRAMQQIFDRKLLARSPEVASEWSDKLRMDCITLDGDLCSRKGALSGGYVDVQKSRIKAYGAKTNAEASFRRAQEEHRGVDAEAKQAEQDVANVSEEISRLQHKQTQLARMIQNQEVGLSQSRSQIGQYSKQAERLESQIIPGLEQNLEDFRFDIARLREEIGTELTSSLSEEERSALNELKQVQVGLHDKIADQRDAVEELRAERTRLEFFLENNLYRRRTELTQVNNTLDSGEGSGGMEGGVTTNTMLQEQAERQLEERRLAAREAIRDADELEAKLEEIRKAEEELKNELIGAKNDLERLKTVDNKNTRDLDDAQRRAETLMGKKSLNIGRRDNYMRKIQELGSLPPDSELRHYKNQNISDLERSLERVSKKLKKYSHVNKKAFDQYVNFSEKRESLMDRKDELDRGAEKVKELVESLDRKKDEAINRTFRGVSKHFAEVFKELVPLGAGELIMRTAIDEALDRENEDEDPDSNDGESAGKKRLENPDVSLYRGVGIKVRFSAVGENFIMSQLSGGQKALVAMALIFAIQRCDPAPFYIFDELDQALDSTYRQAVANVIYNHANNPDNPTQFITSTFRPELVRIAKNCYGISHQNKVSSIHSMTKNDALKFIANLMSEEEAVGQVSTTRSSLSKKGNKKRKSNEVETAVEASQEPFGIQTQPMEE